MERGVVGYEDWTEGFTFSGGSYESDFPVTNLAVEPMTRVAKSTSIAESATQFQAVSSTIRPVRFLGLCRHNLSDFAEIRIKLYSDVALTEEIYDSDWDRVWLPAYTSSGSSWYRPGFWLGIYSPSEKEGLTPHRFFWLDQTYFVRGIKVFIRDPNNEDGRAILGLFKITEGLQLLINPDIGASFGIRNRNVEIEAEGGIVYSEEKRALRYFRGQVSYMDLAISQQRWFEFLRRMKTNRTFIWSKDPSDRVNLLRDGGLYRNKEVGPITHSGFDVATVQLDFEEVLG